MVIRRREKILIGVSILLFGGAWILTSSPSPKPSATEPPAKSQAVTVDTVKALTTASEHVAQEPTVGTQDPFAPISKNGAVEATGVAAFKLQGTFSDEKGKAAIVNEKVVHEGEEIAPGVKLETISSGEVTIKGLEGDVKVGFQ